VTNERRWTYPTIVEHQQRENLQQAAFANFPCRIARSSTLPNIVCMGAVDAMWKTAYL